MGEFTDKAKGTTDQAIGNVKQESGNPETRDEGKMQEEKGEIASGLWITVTDFGCGLGGDRRDCPLYF